MAVCHWSTCTQTRGDVAVLEFVTSLAEYQKFGLNTTTITAIGILCITLFQAWGMTGQVRTIWRTRSGEGLSVLWFSYTMWFFVAAIVYAFHTRSGAMLVNASVMMTGHLAILAGLWRFKGWTWSETGQTVLYAAIPMIVAMVPDTRIEALAMPGTDAAFMVFSFGTIYAVATQPWEMWRKKTAGIVAVKLIAVHILAVVFWTVYAFHIGAVALQILNPILFVLFALTVLFWFMYREQESKATA